MAEGRDSGARMLNPCLFHLEKLGLELKCAVCMDLLSKPVLLPCNHMFCALCVPRLWQPIHSCPACQQHYTDKEIRPASYMEGIIQTYRSLDATFSSSIYPFLSVDKHPETDRRGKEVHANAVGTNSHVNQATEMSPGSSCKGSYPDCAITDTSIEDKDATMVTWKPPQSKGKDHREASATFIKAENADSPSLKMTTDHRIRKSGRVVLDTATYAMDDEGTYNVKKPKKQKRKRGLSGAVPCASNGEEVICHADQVAVSNANECMFEEDPPLTSIKKLCDDDSSVIGSACAFCQCSEITESSGPLLHLVNGREVPITKIDLPKKAVTAHLKCIEWTPKVYFAGDKVKNLKCELSRASKLKCSACGLKGATLGCLAKSCSKSYHFPCTLEIPDCRWDSENFLMLCPTHRRVKFPSELCSSRKHNREIMNSSPQEEASEQSNFWASFPSGPQEWVLCGSALSSEQKRLLRKFAATCGAQMSNSWNSNVTHVIASTDHNGACCRSLKVLMAILNGKWILTIDWVKACMDANHPVNEEPFEINIDNHGCRDGPRTGRLRALNNDQKLFSGALFCFRVDFDPSYKSDLVDLVIAGGGTISNDVSTTEQDPQTVCATTLIVYFNEHNREHESTMKKEPNSDAPQVIPHTLILESIAACRVLSRPAI